MTPRRRIASTITTGDATSDLVVGVPNASVSGKAGAGAVDVHCRTQQGGGPAQRISESLFPLGNISYNH